MRMPKKIDLIRSAKAMRIEILADFIVRHDPDFIRFLEKSQGAK